MNNRSEAIMTNRAAAGNIFSWITGIGILLIGLINTFWGNDMAFGIFIVLLSFVFYPPVNALVARVVGFSIPVVLKVLIALFVLWAALGVGELFAKIELMMKDLG